MRRILFIFMLVVSGVVIAEKKPFNPTLKAEVNHKNALYKINEPIVFTMWALKDTKPLAGVKFEYLLTGDGGLKKSGTVTSSLQGVKLKTKLARPGFVLLLLRKEKIKGTYKHYKHPYYMYVKAYAGAGVEPTKIKASRPVPTDFDQFWAKRKADLKAIPYTVKLKPQKADKRYAGKLKIYNVWLNGKDDKLNVTGQMAMPINAKPGTLPIIATFNGASSVGSRADKSQALNYHALVFNMSLHDMKPTIKRNEIQKYRKLVRHYQYNNSTNPDKYAMKDIFLRVLRSLEYLKTRPEWDHKRIIVRGGSLGGCQAIIAAALDQDVTLCAANAAAMCDHTGYLAKQSSGWPQLLKRHPEAIKLAPYFDTANFATRIKCPVFMTAGFIDVICPATSIYAAYNNIPGKQKKMYHSITGGHGGSVLRKGDTGVYGFVGHDVRKYIKSTDKK